MVWVTGIHNVESGVGGNHDGNFRSGDARFNQTFDLVFDSAFLDAHIISGNVYPYYWGNPNWQKRTAGRLGLESSLRPKGRPRLEKKK